MAVHEHDREDLLRDGRQMPARGECVIEGTTVLCGFRDGGQLSLYCGPDPVFQFNSNRELRRVYYDGRRFAAQRGQLAELTRERRGGRVEFVSKTVDAETCSIIMLSLWRWITRIQDALESRPDEWRAANDEASVLRQRLTDWIQSLPTDLPIALSPNA